MQLIGQISGQNEDIKILQEIRLQCAFELKHTFSLLFLWKFEKIVVQSIVSW